MNSLFDDNNNAGPYGSYPQRAPQASPSDPITSHLAAEQHEASGRAKRNRDIVLALVKENPGSTSVELHAAQGDRYDLDRHEVSRRLSDLKNYGVIRQGYTRKCEIRKADMVTWYLVD